MRTLLLGDDRPARYSLGPYKLPVEPLVWPLASGTAADRVLKELHAEMSLRRKLREPRIASQVVTSELRLDLGGDRIAAELARELGLVGERVLSHWERGNEVSRLLDPLLTGDHAFPGTGFFERRELSKFAASIAERAEAWAADCAADPNIAILTQLAAIALRHPAPPPAAVARALDMWFHGVLSFRGDGDAIRELLVEKLTTAGGEVRAGSVVEAGISWGKISSLQLTTGDEIGVGQVVSSQAPTDLAIWFGKRAPKRLAEIAEAMSIVGYRYSINLLLDQAGIPEHMAPNVAVIAAPNMPPVGDAAFSIHLGESDESGHVVATVAAIMPSDGPIDPERVAAKSAALRAALWNRLADVMPFFDRHVVLAHSPFEITLPHVPGGRGSYDVPKHLPLAMAPIWTGNLASTAGLSATPYLTGLKNLTLTGGQVLPSLGVEGSLVAGWSAAKIACALAGKKKDYLRDEVVGSS
jgi:phytoene dehydrogenase-like protein